jgi:AraC-like DNA-binding protein
MNKKIIDKLPRFRQSRFRNPTSAEKKLGLWVDRIGGGRESGIQNKLRILGMYGAVRIEGNRGCFINAATGEEKPEDGDIMLLFPDVPAMYYPDESWNVKWILWNGPEANLLRELEYISPSKPLVKNCPAMTEFHSELTSIIQREDMSAILERKNIIISLVKELYKAANRKDKANDNLMEKAVNYIKSNTDKDLSVNTLAADFNLSSTHFRRLFKAYAGMSPKEYMLSNKITRAKKELTEGRSIKEISDELGFCDVFHFMRTFKKIAGINPGQFC